MSTEILTPAEALDLWLTVPRLPISKRERRILDAAENFTIPFQGLMPPGGDFDLHVTSWGNVSHPLVLLVHGWGGHRAQLVGFVKPLTAASFRAVSFDAPAHGDLPGTRASGYQIAEAMHAVVDKVGMPYAVIAHSLGTMSVTVALADWLNVQKLVFLRPYAQTRRYAGTFPQNESFAGRNGCGPESSHRGALRRRCLGEHIPRFDPAQDRDTCGHLPRSR
jgi:pimeloyl-ACP methyl ester carboxylesterase